MRARVDVQTCQSSGNCLRDAPDVFAWNDDHLARVKEDAAALDPVRLVEIARNCPALAIVLLDDEGRDIDPFDVP